MLFLSSAVSHRRPLTPLQQAALVVDVVGAADVAVEPAARKRRQTLRRHSVAVAVDVAARTTRSRRA